jgi:hypothetical protein
MTRRWIAVVSLILFAPSGAAASVLYANPTDPACNGGSPCFGTIQAAIDVAGAGDVVRLQAGTYVERVLVSGKNAASSASESDRIRIEADPDASVGSVVLDGAVDVCTNGSAIRFQQSKFVTVEGLTITAAGGQAIELMGGNNGNQAIHVERNRIFGNGSTSCNGGITMARGNPDTLIANNLIYGNGRNGVATIDADGGPHILVGNTIYANGWNGIRVTRSHLALLANNLIFGNGTSSGSTGGRFGVQRESSTTPDPAGIRLLHDVICANRLGEIDGPVLDASDAANLTPGGAEGAGVVASAGCAVAAQVFESLGDPASAQIDFGLTEGSPAIDVGLDPRALGLGAALDTSFEADFSGSAERPLDGDDDGIAAFDAGALEVGGEGPPPGPTPTVVIATPTDGAVVTQSPSRREWRRDGCRRSHRQWSVCDPLGRELYGEHSARRRREQRERHRHQRIRRGDPDDHGGARHAAGGRHREPRRG